jgi:drug/metabolite transporter (DMT)-like permease
MLSALASTMLFSVQNIYSKKIMRQRVLDHLNLLFQSTRAAFLVILPLWFFTGVHTCNVECWHAHHFFCPVTFTQPKTL